MDPAELEELIRRSEVAYQNKMLMGRLVVIECRPLHTDEAWNLARNGIFDSLCVNYLEHMNQCLRDLLSLNYPFKYRVIDMWTREVFYETK